MHFLYAGTLELITNQTILSSQTAFLSARYLWRKGSGRPPGCCIFPARKGTGPRTKQNRWQNESGYGYHQLKSQMPHYDPDPHLKARPSDLTVSCLHQPSSHQVWEPCWLSKTPSGHAWKTSRAWAVPRSQMYIHKCFSWLSLAQEGCIPKGTWGEGRLPALPLGLR